MYIFIIIEIIIIGTIFFMENFKKMKKMEKSVVPKKNQTSLVQLEA
jgi:uncharacterized protein YkvS